MEATKTHQGKVYAFDATAQGKGLWKQVTKAGKLGKIASKDLQQLWGNPNDFGASYDQSAQTGTDQSNVMKFGEMIKDKAPTPGRLRTFRSMLTDPNETVGSAAVKGIKQRLRPEILVKNLFGKTAGLMAAKGLGVSPERMEAVEKGFSNASSSRGEVAFSGKIKGGSAEASKEVVNELRLIRLKNDETYNEIKKISDYVKEKAKKEDIAGDKRALPTKTMSSPVGTATAGTGAAENVGGGLLDSIMSMFGGAAGGFSLAAIGKTIFDVLKKVLKKVVTKIPIIGALVLAAFGLKDAYDEYVESGDFGSAVGAFFESVADSLTFGLSTSMLGEGGIKNFVKAIVDDTTEMFTKFFDSAKEWLDKNIIKPAGEMWEKIKENLPEFNIGETIDSLKTKFGNAITGVKNFILEDLINPIVSIPGKIVGTLKSIVASLFEKLGEFELKLPEFTPKNPITGTEYKLGGQSFRPFSNLSDYAKTMRDSGAQETNPTAPAITPIAPTPTPATPTTPSVPPVQSQPITAAPIQPVPAGTDLRNMPPTGLPVPQPRTTGNAIQQSAQDLAASQNAAQTPAAPVIVNNNTTNNTMAGGGGGGRGPVAPVRNEDSTMQRAMMDSALMGAF